MSRLSFQNMDEQPKDPDVLNVLVLERVDRTKNMARYYVLSVEPWLLVKLVQHPTYRRRELI